MAEQRERLPELTEPCPRCRGVEWELATASPEDRAAVCAACGYRQDIPQVVSTTTTVDPSGFAPEERIAETRRDLWERAVADLGRSHVGLAVWPGERRLGGWSAAGPGKSDAIISVSLEHDHGYDRRADPRVEIQTGVSVAFDPVEHWLVPWLVILRSDEWREEADGDAAYAREELRRYKVERRVRSVAVGDIALSVDGEAVSFAVLGEEDVWAAYADHDGIGITIATRGVPAAEIELSSADPDAYLP